MSDTIPVLNTPVPITEDENSKGYTLAGLALFAFLTNAQMLPLQEYYDPIEDFNWFTSGKIEIESFRGQYIAIWKKQIVGNGRTALEAELLAKARFGNDCRPAVVYIPEDENTIL